MIGEVIGSFRIVERLGKGGMGEVWRAEQKEIKTPVAIKILLAQVSTDRQQVERFFNEAVAVSKIKHSGIAKIFDVGFHGDDRAYLIMEFLDGETLAARIRRLGRLPMPQLLDIGGQLAGVLEATHAESITHRDLKPDNVFIVADKELPRGERVKVLDFGIAKLGDAVGVSGATGTSSMGTPAYMSPEQWRATAKVDGRADLYSLGCLLFEATCGRPPFKASSIGEMCDLHLNAEPPAVSSVRPGIPAALDKLLARLLAKSPDDRPTLAEVRRELAAIDTSDVTGETLDASGLDAAALDETVDSKRAAETRDTAAPRVDRTPPGKPRRWRIALALLALAGVSASAVVLVRRGGDASNNLSPRERVEQFRAKARFDLAAKALEDQARPGGPDAASLLREAAGLREALGDDPAALDDLQRSIAGGSDPVANADARLRIAAIHDRRGRPDDAIAELAKVLPEEAAAGVDQRLIASARTARLLWRQSCTGKTELEVCADRVPPSNLARSTLTRSAPVMCGPDMDAHRLVTRARGPRGLEAVAAARRAIDQYEVRAGKTGGDERIVLADVSMARLIDADASYEAYLAVSLPEQPVSAKEFDDWLTRKTAAADAALGAFQKVVVNGAGASSMHAAERMGEIAENFAHAVMADRIPDPVRNDDKQLEAYCDRRQALATPLEERAMGSFVACTNAAARLGLVDEWSTACREHLMRLRPDQSPLMVEVVALPRFGDATLGPAPAARTETVLSKVREQLARMRTLTVTDPEWVRLDADARTQLTSVLERDTSEIRVYVLLAYLYFEGSESTPGRLELARLVLEQAGKVAPTFVPLGTATGVLRFRMHDSAGALSAFEDAAASDRGAQMNLGLLYLQLGRYADAAAKLAMPSDAGYDEIVAGGVALRGTEKLAEAEQAYKRAIALAPKRPEAYYAAGILYKDFMAPRATDLSASRLHYATAIDYLRNAEQRSKERIGAEAGMASNDCARVITQLDAFIANQKK